jgi:acetolactate synthase-1/2/3 large subunit
VCFSGDGSILMNMQELLTAVEVNANIKIIVMDNASLGLVFQQQTLFYGERIYASRFKTVPDFVNLALACGMHAVDLDQEAKPRAALAAALSMHDPVLIHAAVDVHQQVLPMVPPGAANREMIGD